jgi:hypothetical protein
MGFCKGRRGFLERSPLLPLHPLYPKELSKIILIFWGRIFIDG